MNQFVSSSGATAPPVDWISELYTPARQVSASGQPSFADIFQTQAASANTEAFPSVATSQNYSTELKYQESVQSEESERYEYRSYEQQSEEEYSEDDPPVDSSGDPIKAAEAASAQVSNSKPVDEPEVDEKPIEAKTEEDGTAEEKVDGKKAIFDSEVKQAQNILSSILKFQGVQVEHETDKTAVEGITDETASKTKVKLASSDSPLTAKQDQKAKVKANTESTDVVAAKQDTTQQAAVKTTEADKKVGINFAETVSNAAKNADKPQQDSSKKTTKVEAVSGNGELTQTTFETNKVTGSEKITRTETTSHVAESKSLNPSEQIVKSVDVMIKNGQTSMKVQLQPENLGKIELRLVQNESGLMVAMIPDEATTSSLLESQLSELRNTLTSSGIQLTDVWIGQQEQAEKQDWWSSKGQHSKYNGNLEGELEEDEPQLARQKNYSLSGYDYLV